MINYVIILVLSILVIFLLVRLIVLKGNVRDIRKELENTRTEEYNRDA